MINAIGKVNMVHVPYKTGAQIPTDLMGGQIRSCSVAAGDGDARK